ncbi:hypothetical protein Clacol_003074 [Clathrus columnatus]|uniref:Uncharacterized protein n=1 Tax=Clathrus columnatus TaxID=1419009 RepID=A0AAV5A6I0_9AGAM|nr:hypothetical protein Clacol_003074 [Clathrus columnatus]
MSDVAQLTRYVIALIRPEGAPNQTVYSKYRIEGTLDNPETGIKEIWTFNVNSDVAVPRFWSVSADKKPPERTVLGTYTDMSQFAGFDRFSGAIGDSKFYLRTDRGVVFKGDIVGDPTEGQSFTSAGTWFKSQS